MSRGDDSPRKVVSVRVIVSTSTRFEARQQFHPLERDDIEFFHDECRGGLVTISTPEHSRDLDVGCSVCGASAAINSVDLKAALRRVLIDGSTESVGSIVLVLDDAH
jgi:hypothetical protein